MTTLTVEHVEFVEELDQAALTCVGGGRINLGRVQPPPIEPGHGGIGAPYWDTAGANRYGAGPWDYGYGSPTGPWPV